MTSLTALTAQQREIGEIVSTIRFMLSSESARPAGLDSVMRLLLCDLCRKVRGHLVEEDEELYPDLMAHDDLHLRHMAWGFRSGDRTLCHRFEEYYNRWLEDDESEFRGQLLDDTLSLLGEIEERIDREQRYMFPQLRGSGVLTAAPR
jgi:hypothetical protein